MTGYITHIIAEKGFCFICPDDRDASGDVFAHFRVFADGAFALLMKGDRVVFTVARDPKHEDKRRATSVIVQR